ncbi:fibrinogen-like protein A [Dysidea avara]|uniref:fibrinogen-like protein A n=1 Tax=Dysidea avara TaxID=196820 RepID=UPI0033236AAB
MTTTTIMMLVLVLVLIITTGIVATATHDDQCPQGDAPINSCCCLGFNNTTSFNKRRPGVYTISNFCGNKCHYIQAYCDTITSDGGWLVIQRRQNGAEDFNRSWYEYEDGFGDLNDEFWYGLKALHCLTGDGGWEMLMDIKLTNGSRILYHYKKFIVGSPETNYKLNIGSFQGSSFDPMVYHNGMLFTTKDRDHDMWSKNCATNAYGPTTPAGGWWHRSCYYVSPNVFYNFTRGVVVDTDWQPMPFVEIKIRPLNCLV